MIILFLDTVHPSLAERLTADGHECIDCTSANKMDVTGLLHTAHGIVLRSRYTMDEEFLADAADLRFIARSGVGMENIDVDYCQNRGITAFNAAGANANAVGEHVLGMILCQFNKLHIAQAEVRSGLWRREAMRGKELGSMTVGLIGFGHTGQSVARKLSGFGCEVLAYDKYKSVDLPGVQSVQLQEIQERSGLISFHVPLTEETHHYFDQMFLDSVLNPFYLVNASRGKVVSTDALLAGLESKKLLGVCLDVLEQEGSDFDLSNNSDVQLQKLIAHPKVLFSPHVAGWTVESYQNLADSLYEQIKAI